MPKFCIMHGERFMTRTFTPSADRDNVLLFDDADKARWFIADLSDSASSFTQTVKDWNLRVGMNVHGVGDFNDFKVVEYTGPVPAVYHTRLVQTNTFWFDDDPDGKKMAEFEKQLGRMLRDFWSELHDCSPSDFRHEFTEVEIEKGKA